MTNSAAAASLPVSFLTDFGLEDEFVGVCHAVIAGIDPDIRVIDVTHGIAPGDVRRAALALSAFVAYSPPAVHLAVVDPGVGTDRRAVAASAGDHFLVGPDNGLLAPAIDRLGGADQVVEISDSPVRSVPTSRTFHGRDLFSPVAASLAARIPLDRLGDELDAAGLTHLELPEPELREGSLIVHALISDRYGNVSFDADRDLGQPDLLSVGRALLIEIGGSAAIEVRFGETFADADPGQPLLYFDSSGNLTLAVNGGDAARQFSLGPDDELSITPL